MTPAGSTLCLRKNKVNHEQLRRNTLSTVIDRGSGPDMEDNGCVIVNMFGSGGKRLYIFCRRNKRDTECTLHSKLKR